MAGLGEVDQREIVGGHGFEGFVEVHFVAEYHVAVEGDETAELPGLSSITYAYVEKLHALACIFEQADDRGEWLKRLDRPMPRLSAHALPREQGFVRDHLPALAMHQGPGGLLASEARQHHAAGANQALAAAEHRALVGTHRHATAQQHHGGRGGGQRSGQADGARGEAGKAQVTVVTASGALETRDVEVGIRNRVSAEIRSGLEEGEKIVVSTGTGTGTGSSGNARDGRGLRGMRMPPMF